MNSVDNPSPENELNLSVPSASLDQLMFDVVPSSSILWSVPLVYRESETVIATVASSSVLVNDKAPLFILALSTFRKGV